MAFKSRRGGARQRAHAEAGYTLTEMLVVLVIIGLLVAIVGPRLFNRLDSAKRRTAEIQATNLAAALDMYALDMGRLPSADEGIDALVRAPEGASDWMGPYLARDAVPEDPWGRAYALTLNESEGAYSIASLGADGREGGAGAAADIVVTRSVAGGAFASRDADRAPDSASTTAAPSPEQARRRDPF